MPTFRRTVTLRRPRHWRVPSKTTVHTISVTTQPSTAASGVANAGIVITSSDNTFTGNVTLAKKTGKGTLSGTLTVAAVAGVATFSNIVITGAGPHVLTASASGYADVDTSSFTITHAVATAWAALVAAHGGDSKWQAIAHHQVNVTAAGGKASQVDDVRGLLSGGMVPLAQATAGKRPVLSVDGLVFTAADQCELVSALDSRIVMNGSVGMWAMVICKSPGASQPILVISEDPTDVDELPYLVASTGSANYQAQFNVGSTDFDAVRDLGTPIGNTTRAIILSREPSHSIHAGDYTVKGAVLGRRFKFAAGIQPVPSATGSGMKIGVGQFDGTHADVTVLGWVVSTQPLTKALAQDLALLLQAHYGMTLSLIDSALYEAGTSTNRAHNCADPVGLTTGGTSAASYLCANTSPTWASRGLDADIFGMNASANGTWIDDQIALLPHRFELNTAFTRVGRRDAYEIGGALTQLLAAPYNGVGGADLLITQTEALIAAIHAAGGCIVLQTIMDYGGITGTGFTNGFYDQPGGVPTLNQIGTNALDFNTWVRTDALLLDGVVGIIDYEAQAGNIAKINLGGTKAYTNATNFDGSGHPTTAHQALMGAVKRAFYDANPTILFDGAPLPVLMNLRRQYAA